MGGRPAGRVQGSGSVRATRVPWLDGVRALAATYVMVHHIWLYTWPGYPDNDGPAYLGWLDPGRFGVVVFIVVSGYSLTLAPLDHDGRLPGGVGGFARRRAWRILPPYWAALIVSTALVDLLVAPADGPVVDLRSFVVHAALVQDLTANVTPNGAFWSIAVEAQIYVVFPLVLLTLRRFGPTKMVAVVGLVVAVAHIAATHGPQLLHKIENVTPQLFVAFAFGVAAAALTRADGILVGRLAGRWVVLAIALLVVAAMWAVGPRFLMVHAFWSDLAVAGVTAGCFVAFGRSSRSIPLLTTRPLQALGRISYSTYLIHAPVLLVILLFIVRPLNAPPLVSFFLLLAIGLPMALAAAYLFFLVCEKPFLTVRSFAQLGRYLHISHDSGVTPPASAGLELDQSARAGTPIAIRQRSPRPAEADGGSAPPVL